MIRLAIIDDHPVFREGLRRVLERAPDFAVVWDSGTSANLIQDLEQDPVDVVLLDLYLGPEDDSLAAARAARERFSDIRIIVVSASLVWDSVTASRQAGALSAWQADSSAAPADLASGAVEARTNDPQQAKATRISNS